MLGLGGLVKNWTIVGFEVKCLPRPSRAFLEKVKTSKESYPVWVLRLLVFEDNLEVRFGILIVV